MASRYKIESWTKKFTLEVFEKSARILLKDNKGKYTVCGSKVFWIKQPMDLEAAGNLVDLLDEAFKLGKEARSQEFKKLLGE